MEEEYEEKLLENSPSINSALEPSVRGKPWFPYRYRLVLLTCVGFVFGMSCRTSFNIALVDMVNFTTTHNYTSDECVEPDQPSGNTSSKLHNGDFNWDSRIQSLLLGAFFYGYVITQLVGGFVAEVKGPKTVLLLAVLVPSLLSVVSPWMAKWSPIALFITRFLMGVAQGPLYPALTVLLRNWGRSDEISLMYSIINTGGTLGTLLGPIITGILCDLTFMGGWPLSFYIFGCCGLLWSILWFFVAHNNPDDHPNLSHYEREYITNGRSYCSKGTSMKRPVGAMIKSKAVWCVMVYYLFDGLGYYGIFSGVPIYMRQILKFDIAENGFLNAVPYIGMMITNMLGGIIADWVRKTYITTKTTRKICCFIGEGFQAGFILAIGFIPCDRVSVIVIFTLAMTFNGISVSGASVNWLDIAPKYAGTLMGVSNLISNFGGFVSPMIIGAITKDSPRRSDWQIVFYMTAGSYALATISFLLFGEGEEQPWAKDDRSMDPLITNVHPSQTSIPVCDNGAAAVSDDIDTGKENSRNHLLDDSKGPQIN